MGTLRETANHRGASARGGTDERPGYLYRRGAGNSNAGASLLSDHARSNARALLEDWLLQVGPVPCNADPQRRSSCYDGRPGERLAQRFRGCAGSNPSALRLVGRSAGLLPSAPDLKLNGSLA